MTGESETDCFASVGRRANDNEGLEDMRFEIKKTLTSALLLMMMMIIEKTRILR